MRSLVLDMYNYAERNDNNSPNPNPNSKRCTGHAPPTLYYAPLTLYYTRLCTAIHGTPPVHAYAKPSTLLYYAKPSTAHLPGSVKLEAASSIRVQQQPAATVSTVAQWIGAVRVMQWTCAVRMMQWADAVEMVQWGCWRSGSGIGGARLMQ